jgi:hypothetical protein
MVVEMKKGIRLRMERSSSITTLLIPDNQSPRHNQCKDSGIIRDTRRCSQVRLACILTVEMGEFHRSRFERYEHVHKDLGNWSLGEIYTAHSVYGSCDLQ